MSGKTNLKTLLSNLSPTLIQETFVFCTFQKGSYTDFTEIVQRHLLWKREGLSLVLEKAVADNQGFNYSTVGLVASV